MVNDEGGSSKGVELVDPVLLDGAGVFAGGFDFDEPHMPAGEDDEAVWDACGAGAGEFPAQSTGRVDCAGEGLFNDGFTHGSLRSWDKCDSLARVYEH
ncbi:hypothetical protein [Trueperella bernardiae]|uniref:hypothetical protein n=1 Tax=Trueperella bernardiae TaxID=59561 RepID=UPI00374EE8BA